MLWCTIRQTSKNEQTNRHQNKSRIVMSISQIGHVGSSEQKRCSKLSCRLAGCRYTGIPCIDRWSAQCVFKWELVCIIWRRPFFSQHNHRQVLSVIRLCSSCCCLVVKNALKLCCEQSLLGWWLIVRMEKPKRVEPCIWLRPSAPILSLRNWRRPSASCIAKDVYTATRDLEIFWLAKQILMCFVSRASCFLSSPKLWSTLKLWTTVDILART